MYSIPTLAGLRNVLKMGAEEPTSFASRLAVGNGVDASLALCQQVLVRLDGLRQGEEKAIGVLAIVADIPPAEILRRTLRRMPEGTIAIGDVAMARSFAAKFSDWLCPACLREDTDSASGRTIDIHDRTLWHLSFLLQCPDHDLEQVAFSPHPLHRVWRLDAVRRS